jgi:hypothetical protein
MNGAPALKLAVDLFNVPSGVRRARSQPLPDGIVTILRIAAGEEAILAEASQTSARPPELVRAAAAFFIEQILLGPGGDSYKTLGAHPTASTSELRRNMALLLRWLHPDMDRQGGRSIFAGRVTMAWENLKTPERRAAYDSTLLSRRPKLRSRKGDRKRPWTVPRFAVGLPFRREGTPGLLKRAMLRLLRGAST